MPAVFPPQAHSTGVAASLVPLEQRGEGRPGLLCGGHMAPQVPPPRVRPQVASQVCLHLSLYGAF